MDADVTVTLARAALDRVIGGEATLPRGRKRRNQGRARVSAVEEFLAMLDEFDFWFNIIEP